MGFWDLSIIRLSKHIIFLKMDLFSSSGEGVGDSYSVGSFRKKANSNHWTPCSGLNRVGVSNPPHLRTEADLVSETLCSLEYLTMDKVQKSINPDSHAPSA
jgi:hypothetical protein